ncbi:hypothetical protein FGO68_gene2335 [Halteria grandinella]|uniref:Uncharacterized protein n=1 Tax=Halteria grandinella TaxID=5974 RepID=A0A8J8TAY0_HALGN|nr:hypothetical protein FGO68_gene2335 [Halteria grandinella]
MPTHTPQSRDGIWINIASMMTPVCRHPQKSLSSYIYLRWSFLYVKFVCISTKRQQKTYMNSLAFSFHPCLCTGLHFPLAIILITDIIESIPSYIIGSSLINTSPTALMSMRHILSTSHIQAGSYIL